MSWPDFTNAQKGHRFDVMLQAVRRVESAPNARSVTAAGMILAVFLLSAASTGSTLAQESSVLVFSKTAGFRHDSIEDGVAMIEGLGDTHGFGVDHTEDASVFKEATLAGYDAVVFLSTTGDILDADQQDAFAKYIQEGGGFVGIHSSADSEYDWPGYRGLVAAYFASPPAVQDAVVVVNDRVQPSTLH